MKKRLAIWTLATLATLGWTGAGLMTFEWARVLQYYKSTPCIEEAKRLDGSPEFVVTGREGEKWIISAEDVDRAREPAPKRSER